MTTTQRKGPLNEMGRMAQSHFEQLHVVTIATELKGCFRCAIAFLVGEVRSSWKLAKKKFDKLVKFLKEDLQDNANGY